MNKKSGKQNETDFIKAAKVNFYFWGGSQVAIGIWSNFLSSSTEISSSMNAVIALGTLFMACAYLLSRRKILGVWIGLVGVVIEIVVLIYVGQYIGLIHAVFLATLVHGSYEVLKKQK
jgi:hypothetical protein